MENAGHVRQKVAVFVVLQRKFQHFALARIHVEPDNLVFVRLVLRDDVQPVFRVVHCLFDRHVVQVLCNRKLLPPHLRHGAVIEFRDHLHPHHRVIRRGNKTVQPPFIRAEQHQLRAAVQKHHLPVIAALFQRFRPDDVFQIADDFRLIFGVIDAQQLTAADEEEFVFKRQRAGHVRAVAAADAVRPVHGVVGGFGEHGHHAQRQHQQEGQECHSEVVFHGDAPFVGRLLVKIVVLFGVFKD